VQPDEEELDQREPVGCWSCFAVLAIVLGLWAVASLVAWRVALWTIGVLT
jgi:hypothetical protein